MTDIERRLEALELVLTERLALEPMPVLVHIEDSIRDAMRKTAPEAREVQEAALQFLTRARGGFDAYWAGYGIPSPDERPASSTS